jgi:hypothetical protein
MLQDEDRKVTAIVAVIRDETVRWGAERQLKARVAELEATAGVVTSI